MLLARGAPVLRHQRATMGDAGVHMQLEAERINQQAPASPSATAPFGPTAPPPPARLLLTSTTNQTTPTRHHATTLSAPTQRALTFAS